jgi:uncharacterized protein (DUF58 family)
MRPSLTPKLGAYAALAAGGFLAALLFQRAEAAVIALPFALVAFLGLATAREPRFELEASIDRERLLEGEQATLAVRLRALAPVHRLELSLRLPAGLVVAEGSDRSRHSLGAGEERTVELRVEALHWGVYEAGWMTLRARDRFGLLLFERVFAPRLPLRVYPRPDALRAMLGPLETQTHAGNTVSRERGGGIEFADVRPFVAGDRVRHVNWRVSARRGELHVNQHHPERNADVVIFLDTFAEVGGNRTTIDLAVRGAAGIAARYLESRDRVGLIGFGGILRWLRPGMGAVHLYRLMDSLLDTRVVTSYAWKGIDVIPSGTLPPKALLLALSPLLDERSMGALLDVRGRGFDVAVIEVDPVPMVEARPDPRGELAHRLWLLQRDSLRGRFRSAGIPISTWNEERPLEAALEEVAASRRHAMRVRA